MFTQLLQHRFRQRAVRGRQPARPAPRRPRLPARHPLHHPDLPVPLGHGPSRPGTGADPGQRLHPPLPLAGPAAARPDRHLPHVRHGDGSDGQRFLHRPGLHQGPDRQRQQDLRPDHDPARCRRRRPADRAFRHPADPVHRRRGLGGHQHPVPDAGRHGAEPGNAGGDHFPRQLQLGPGHFGVRRLPVEPDQPEVLRHPVRPAQLDHAAVAAPYRRLLRGTGGEVRLPRFLPDHRAARRADPDPDCPALAPGEQPRQGAGGPAGTACRRPRQRTAAALIQGCAAPSRNTVRNGHSASTPATPDATAKASRLAPAPTIAITAPPRPSRAMHSVADAQPEGVNRQPGHQARYARVKPGRQQRHQQPGQERPQGAAHQRGQRIAVGNPVDDQVAQNQPAEYRQLPHRVGQGAEPFVMDQQYRRQANPADQRQADQPQCRAAGHEAPVAEQLRIAREQRQQVDRLEVQARAIPALDAEGFRHEAIQGNPRDHGHDAEQHEQPAPRHPLQQQRTHQRAEQGRKQGDVRQQRHHPHGVRLAERLVQRRVADRDHEAQADALEQAQQVEHLDAVDPEGGQAHEAEERTTAEQQRATAIAVGQRADQPLQEHAAQQVQVQGVGNVLGAGIQVGHHLGHGRHDHVTGEVGEQFEQGQGQGEAQGPERGDLEQRGHGSAGRGERDRLVCQKSLSGR
ncbi:hypothetical protein L1887_60073 [Cichorium endivia]|nr:hypothetical protein L1887_60073 [Cichorium endivia]